MAPQEKKEPRVRQIIDTTEEIRSALQLRSFRLSAERGYKVSVSDTATELLAEVLRDELADVRRRIAKDEKLKHKK